VNEPRRLLDDPACLAIDRAVLLSAADDGPSEEARRAAKIALGIGVGATLPALTSGTATATTKVAAWATALKLSAAVIVSGATVTLVAAGGLGSEDGVAPLAPQAGPPAPSTVVTPRQEAPSSVAPRAPLPRVEAVRVDALPTATVRSATPARAGPRMADEIAAIDHARLRLASGDAASALDELAAYDRRHPTGILAREALMLRVDAHFALGDAASARRDARAYVERYPTSPAAPRLRRLLENEE
jgi:hypothetical protein